MHQININEIAPYWEQWSKSIKSIARMLYFTNFIGNRCDYDRKDPDKSNIAFRYIPVVHAGGHGIPFRARPYLP